MVLFFALICFMVQPLGVEFKDVPFVLLIREATTNIESSLLSSEKMFLPQLVISRQAVHPALHVRCSTAKSLGTGKTGQAVIQA